MPRRLSFRAKISVLIALPLVALMILVGFNIKSQIGNLIDVSKTDRNIRFLEGLSRFVHQLQNERGLTVAYLNAIATGQELTAAREDADEELRNLKPLLENASISAKWSDQFKQTFEDLSVIRGEIANQKLNAREAMSKYSALIDTMTSTYTPIVSTSGVAGVRQRFRSVSGMEFASESASRLRAKLTTVLSRNEPLSSEMELDLLDVYSKVEANLQSRAMVVPADVAKQIKEFHNLSAWQAMTQTLMLVMSKSDGGHYNQDPKAFFDRTAGVMTAIREITQGEITDAFKSSDEEMQSSKHDLILTSLLLLVASFVLIAVSLSVIRSISNGLESIMLRLTNGSDQVAQAARQIASSSTELSEAVTQQSAAIHQTVTSVDEIQAMIEKNRDAADRSKQTSTESTRASRSGKESVDKMIAAIGEISTSNTEMTHQMEHSNREIEEIVKVISEIGTKTKVIDDIVFQTKILSFNASVEAARAGEHGKGFAVVAEEVGNLAQMSGNAAREISSMLENGIKKVEQIVQTTRGRVSQMAANSTSRVDQGRAVAGDCGEALDEILSNVASLDSLVGEISVASQEQAQGVSEVTKAMSQLDQITQKNAVTAQHSAAAGDALNVQSQNLNMLIAELSRIVTGAKLKPAAQEKHENVTPISNIKERATPKPKPQVSRPAPVHKTASSSKKPLKAVAGGVPSENDPRFEEV